MEGMELQKDVVVNKDGGWEWRDLPSQCQDKDLLLWAKIAESANPHILHEPPCDALKDLRTAYADETEGY